MTDTPIAQAGQAYHQARDVYQQVTSPLSEAANTGLDFLLYPFVWPLLELLELVTGDPDQLDRHGDSWRQAAEALRTVATAERQDVDRLAGSWQGEAADAYQARIGDLIQGLRQAGDEMARTADALADAAMDLRAVEEVLRTIIRELVEWLIITWLAAQALAFVTAGASEGAAVAASEAESAIAVIRASRPVQLLGEALARYRGWLEVLKAEGTLGRAAAWALSERRLARIPVKAVTGLDGSVGEVVDSGVDGLVDAALDEVADRRSGDDLDSAFRQGISKVTDLPGPAY
jgi:WXG100 family type VII secretion target